MKNRYAIEPVRHGKVWLIQRTTVDNLRRTGDPAAEVVNVSFEPSQTFDIEFRTAAPSLKRRLKAAA